MKWACISTNAHAYIPRQYKTLSQAITLHDAVMFGETCLYISAAYSEGKVFCTGLRRTSSGAQQLRSTGKYSAVIVPKGLGLVKHALLFFFSCSNRPWSVCYRMELGNTAARELFCAPDALLPPAVCALAQRARSAGPLVHPGAHAMQDVRKCDI